MWKMTLILCQVPEIVIDDHKDRETGALCVEILGVTILFVLMTKTL